MSTSNLGCVVVAVDVSEESMNALRWALRNLRLRSPVDGDLSIKPGGFVILHVQSPPSIAAGLNPGAIPFGGPTQVEVPAFTAAIEAHQRRITEAVLAHAVQICEEKNVVVNTEVVVGDPKEKICEVITNLNADLLVIGCRAFGPIKRMFLGSVSNYCINHVSCPVIVVKETS
ncbi:universal stress protein PHOS34 [Dendrobium catenatum]|uniref:Universal stress protein A-like protein n=1 Tax=Dendrobium catenatum TaxID=906689 RepID=A0A2I0W491_9ASPA|nr:universal stress protein PHOS34 [Dendrobium catenatum]PKU70470.1 Universal stress protein A-like protein [Dendrobium catenatum]